MSTAAYQPEPGSLPFRVCQWFKANLDEELSAADIGQKFDVQARKVCDYLRPALLAQLLDRSRAGTNPVYTAGPALPAWQANPEPAAAATPPAAPRSRGPRVELPDPLTLISKLANNVPLPTARAAAGVRFEQLFQVMKPGESFPCPPPAAKRLIQAAQAFGKTHGRKFALRQLSADEARIWRLS